MIKSSRLKYIEEKVQFLAKQVDTTINWVSKSDLIYSGNENIEDIRSEIITTLTEYRESILSIYGEVSHLDTKRAVEEEPSHVQLDKIQKIQGILKNVVAYVYKTHQNHHNAKLDPFEREVRRASDDLYDEFDPIIPSIANEIEIIEKHFKHPHNSERTIVPELEGYISALKKRQITVTVFLYGGMVGKHEIRGYSQLRTADNIFSRFQDFENIPSHYEMANGSTYNLCKALESFIQEKRTDTDFLSLVERFDILNRKGKAKGSGNKVESMSDLFNVFFLFSQILKKMRIKHSFKDEYKRATKEFEKFKEIHKGLIFYNYDTFNTEKEKILNSSADDGFKKKVSLLFKHIEEKMEEKVILFSKLESIFQQLSNRDLNVIVEEKDADDLRIPVTPYIMDKYGEKVIIRLNLMIEEIEFWFADEEMLYRYEKISVFTNQIQEDEDIDPKLFEKSLGELNDELEGKFRKSYNAAIKGLSQIEGLLEKAITNKVDKEKLNGQLMEKDGVATYIPAIQKIKKHLAVATVLANKPEDQDKDKMSNINKFPFIKFATAEICFLLYELSMRIYTLYPNVDRRSVGFMTDILSIFREHKDVMSLWQSFDLFRNTRVVKNFDIIESRVKMFSKKRVVRERIRELF